MLHRSAKHQQLWHEKSILNPWQAQGFSSTIRQGQTSRLQVHHALQLPRRSPNLLPRRTRKRRSSRNGRLPGQRQPRHVRIPDHLGQAWSWCQILAGGVQRVPTPREHIQAILANATSRV